MTRVLATFLVSLVILGIVFYSYQTYLAPVPTPPPAAVSAESAHAQPAPDTVTAEGVVVPARSVSPSCTICAISRSI